MNNTQPSAAGGGTPTPRTDAAFATIKHRDFTDISMAMFDFARQLETELIIARAERVAALQSEKDLKRQLTEMERELLLANARHAEAVELLREAAELLNEVRTGEDFECQCWEHAEKCETFIKTNRPTPPTTGEKKL